MNVIWVNLGARHAARGHRQPPPPNSAGSPPPVALPDWREPDEREVAPPEAEPPNSAPALSPPADVPTRIDSAAIEPLAAVVPVTSTVSPGWIDSTLALTVLEMLAAADVVTFSVLPSVVT
jgi:hypothetical protein